MANPRRISYSNSSENPIQFQNFSRLSSIKHFLKKPHAFPFLLSIFLLLTWVSLRLQRASHLSSANLRGTQEAKWSKDDDKKANLIRFKSGLFPSPFIKDKRGWIFDPVSLALGSGLKGGALSCASLHVGEIRPGTLRGNHRHYTCNETFVIWGAKTLFRLENNQIVDKGYAEVIVGADEVAIAASPSSTAHLLHAFWNEDGYM
ncbi:uncharacterized protein LOC110622052 isoform X2 [Manihot esculenta]|uniref:Cupin type-1 domain-containing protein n=1 Tax=Manihot esculenta TaxID=3983 RepID=A0A2C9V868_MANES|nr:uncharacterized protein LOC110622052 isoform X2 [Manihot esculenta]OAY40174.1 hypothetical protein MANES_09G001600v8 [Manihot esculenta]